MPVVLIILNRYRIYWYKNTVYFNLLWKYFAVTFFMPLIAKNLLSFIFYMPKSWCISLFIIASVRDIISQVYFPQMKNNSANRMYLFLSSLLNVLSNACLHRINIIMHWCMKPVSKDPITGTYIIILMTGKGIDSVSNAYYL